MARASSLPAILLLVAVAVLGAGEAVPPPEVVARLTKEIQALQREVPKRSAGAAAAALLAEADTVQDPAERYVYLREAIQVAAKSGESTVAIPAMERLVAGFALDALGERAELAFQLARQVKPVVDTSITAHLLLSLCRQAVAAGDDALAGRLASAAGTLSAKHKDPRLSALAKELSPWVTEVAASRKTLPQGDLLGSLSPAEAAATGRHACLLAGDWTRGLPLLAAGDDAVLAKLATSDLAGGGGTAQALELADGWWAVGEKQRGYSRTLVQRHAAGWYRAILPQLTGISRTRVDQRLGDLPADVLAEPAAVDLWPLMSLAKGSFQGQWRNLDGALVVEKNNAGDHLTIPVVPFGDYRFEAGFAQLSDAGEVMILIPVMTAAGPQSLNYFLYDDGSALHTIDDEMISSTSALGRIVPNKRHTVVAEVRQGPRISIIIHLDGREIFRWQGPATAAFGTHRKAKPTRPGALGLGAWNAKAAFHHARFTPLGRTGTLDDLAQP